MSANGQYSLINTRGMTSARKMRALHRAREKPELDKMRKPRVINDPYEFYVNDELTLLGESREYQLFKVLCPVCHYHSMLETKYPHGQDRAYYRVRCASLSSCKESTPWLKSSGLAIQHWKVTAALSK
jgi:hypothetical protein